MRVRQRPERCRTRTAAAIREDRAWHLTQRLLKLGNLRIGDRRRHHRNVPESQSCRRRRSGDVHPARLIGSFAIRPITDDRSVTYAFDRINVSGVDLLRDAQHTVQRFDVHASSPVCGARTAATHFSKLKWNSAIPVIKASVKMPVVSGASARSANAGPGHKPTSPQPTPKTMAPKTSLLSIAPLAGTWKASAASGRLNLDFRSQPAPATANAPVITNASVGSQPLPTVKNASTRAGFTMSDTESPIPNSRPDTMATSTVFIVERSLRSLPTD